MVLSSDAIYLLIIPLALPRYLMSDVVVPVAANLSTYSPSARRVTTLSFFAMSYVKRSNVKPTLSNGSPLL